MITASADGSCRLFEASSGDCLRAYSSHATTTTTTTGVNGVRGGGGSVRLGCLAIAPSGFSLAAGDDAGRVFLWEISTGMLMTVWTGHGKGEEGGGGGGGASLDCVAFSPDGRILASAATTTATSSSRRRRISANGGVNDDDEDHNNEMAMMIPSSHDETTINGLSSSSSSSSSSRMTQRTVSSSSSSSSSSSLLLSSSTLCLWSVEAAVNAIKASSIRGGGSNGGAAVVGASPFLNRGKGTFGLLCSYSLKSTTAHALTFEEDEGLVLVGTHNHV